MKFNPNTHIIGKVYDLTQENMNDMLAEIDRLRAENTLLVLNDDCEQERRILQKERDQLREKLSVLREECALIAEHWGYTFTSNNYQPFAQEFNLKLRGQNKAIADKIRGKK